MGTEKILIVDDEEVIRTLSKIMLERHGFEVVGAGDATTAIRLYAEAQRSGAPFRVVILDLNLPEEIDGVDVLRELKSMDPEVRGILSSGSGKSREMLHYAEFGFDAAVAKPFRMEELVGEVRRVCALEDPR